jgi:Ca-activated chloride channel family protein
VRPGRDGSASFTAPAETGLYETRYLLDAGAQLLGRQSIEVVAQTAGLDAPDRVPSVVRSPSPGPVPATRAIG